MAVASREQQLNFMGKNLADRRALSDFNIRSTLRAGQVSVRSARNAHPSNACRAAPAGALCRAGKGEAVAAAKAPSPANSPTFVGTIKSFDAGRGYGFISCQETFGNYGRDVFVHNKQLRQFEVGDSVSFCVEISSAGSPQAYNLTQPTSSAAWLSQGAEVGRQEGVIFEGQVGQVKSINSLKGYGFIQCEAMYKQCGRDVFFPCSLSEGIVVGDQVEFQARLKNGQPQAQSIKRQEKACAASTCPLTSSSSACTRKLLRACASTRKESYNEMFDLLTAGADPNGQDCTGQTALMISALNSGGGEKKCRLLVGKGADVHAVVQGSLTVLQWARERLSKKFAAHLEALSKGEQIDCLIVLDALGGPSEI